MRRRTESWFADGAKSRTQFDHGDELVHDEWMQTPPRDDMFVSKSDVVAHLVFALATDKIGGRLTLTRLESHWDVDDFTPPTLVTDIGLRVDYLDPNLGVAVVTDESQRRVFQVRLDAITRIDVSTQPLLLDPDKVPALEPTTLSSPGWDKTQIPAQA